MGTDLCARRSGRGIEGECAGGKEAGDIGGENSGGTIYKNERGVRGV